MRHFIQCNFSVLKKRYSSTTKYNNFKKLNTVLNLNEDKREAAIRKCDEINKTYTKILNTVLAGGGQKAIHRHTNINKKLLVYDRLKLLLDDFSSSLILSPLAGLSMDYGDIPSAGLITVIGKISGQYCIVLANDATVKGGTVFPITVKKQLRGQEIALENRLPCIYLVDSGGAFLPLQSEIFPDRNGGGRVFHNQAIMSSEGISQIAVVCGSCTAGGAYVPAMSDEAIIVDRIGTIFLAGPPLVKAATGEEISEEDLGGATVHCRTSGVTDYFATTEEEAFQFCRESVEVLNEEILPVETNNFDEPLLPVEQLKTVAGLPGIDKPAMFQILSCILDGSCFKEFKEKFGDNLITGYGYIHRNLIGIVANCGSLSAPDSQKGAHFIDICDKRGIPLIFLQNSMSNLHIPRTEDGLTIKDQAKMISSLACSTVPKIAVNVGGCFGSDNLTMCGYDMNPTFLFSWPNVDAHFLWNCDLKYPERKLSDDPFTENTAFYCSSRLLNDGIVMPQETRKVLHQCLEITSQQNIKQKSFQAVRRM